MGGNQFPKAWGQPARVWWFGGLLGSGCGWPVGELWVSCWLGELPPPPGLGCPGQSPYLGLHRWLDQQQCCGFGLKCLTLMFNRNFVSIKCFSNCQFCFCWRRGHICSQTVWVSSVSACCSPKPASGHGGGQDEAVRWLRFGQLIAPMFPL